MKRLIGTLLVIPVVAHAAYYLEDEVPQKIAAQMAVAETQYKPHPAYEYNIPFYAQKYLLGPTAVAALKNIIGDLQRSKAITIQGRPDSNGQNDTDLARRRALAIKKYLVTNGISESRISVSIEKEIRFDTNPDVFNSTIYTSESLPDLPRKIKSSFYAEGTSSPQLSQPTSQAAAVTKPTPLGQANSSAIQPSIQSTSPTGAPERLAKVEGTFKVLNQPQLIDKPTQLPVPPQAVSYDYPITAELSSESRSAIARFVTTNKITMIIADGSVAGFKKAKELSTFIAEVTGSRPEIKAKGAPKGLVIVKG
ncbi:OmpA family protein [Methylovorus glucosotrophus]|uniref:OmpA-like domain-containing protein n=1 Tax=Methylovorus glucosotrophus (strain SIP3-4) TaxID=582744 RepID=C6XES7_METGS|nr:OmpA family protein [Methylovorus glucosotrophus]ACT52134.1 hypothetical protein Msip34_2910 [Methylovorus glucosotrophus SIP3-4]